MLDFHVATFAIQISVAYLLKKSLQAFQVIEKTNTDNKN